MHRLVKSNQFPATPGFTLRPAEIPILIDKRLPHIRILHLDLVFSQPFSNTNVDFIEAVIDYGYELAFYLQRTKRMLGANVLTHVNDIEGTFTKIFPQLRRLPPAKCADRLVVMSQPRIVEITFGFVGVSYDVEFQFAQPIS